MYSNVRDWHKIESDKTGQSGFRMLTVDNSLLDAQISLARFNLMFGFTSCSTYGKCLIIDRWARCWCQGIVRKSRFKIELDVYILWRNVVRGYLSWQCTSMTGFAKRIVDVVALRTLPVFRFHVWGNGGSRFSCIHGIPNL
jgi:hypothetical protein